MLCYHTLLLKEFLWFFIILTPVKTIVPVRTAITIYLMIFFVIHILKDVRIWLTNFGSYMVKFFIFGTTSSLFSVIFGRISFIAFGTSGDMKAMTKYQVTSFLTVFTLRNSWVCICILNGSNVLFYIKMMIDDILYWKTTL